MATVNFTVVAPSGAALGTIDGVSNAKISSYTATNISPGGVLPNDIIFCIAPDLLAANGNSAYTVESGVSTVGTGLTLTQTTALEGLFSNYVDNYGLTNVSFVTQEETMLADWMIVKNPNNLNALSIGKVSATIVSAAQTLANDALSDKLAIDPHLNFLTLVSDSGHQNQNFIDVTDPYPTPLPGSMGLFLTALVLLGAYAAKKKLTGA